VFGCVTASDLEFILLDDAALNVLVDLVEDGQHGDVGLAGAGRGADEKVFVGVVGRLVDQGLDPVQTRHPLEHQLGDLGKQSESKQKG